MAALDPPLRLVCFEYRERLKGGDTKPLLVAAEDNDGREYQVVLKLRHPGTRGGHYEGTSLACELICSVLARANGLPVPDYAIVEIPEELPKAIPDPDLKGLLLKNTGESFGCVYHEGLALWDPASRPRSPDILDRLEEVLSFDATVVNGDRKQQKPNLLWRGETVILIDHSLALPCHLWDKKVVDESPLFPDEQVRQHCSYEALHGRERAFEALLSRWIDNVDATALARLRSFVPDSWERKKGDLDCIFGFLGQRTKRFNDITASLRRVVQ